METTQNAKFTISIKRDTLRAALIFAADKDIRYYLNGACLHVGECGDARLIVTDGHRLAVFTIEDQAGAVPGQYLIPRDALKTIKKAARYQPADVLLDIDGERFTIREVYDSGDILAGSKLLDGRFPDWERVLPDPATMDGTPGNYNPDFLADIKKALNTLGDKNGFFYLHQNGRDNSALVVRGDLGFLCVVMPLRADKPELSSLAEFRPRIMLRAIVETAAGGQAFPFNADQYASTEDKRHAPDVVAHCGADFAAAFDPSGALQAAGLLIVAHVGDAPKETRPQSTRARLASGTNKHGHPVYLIYRTAGLEPAGSGVRFVGESWGCIVDIDGFTTSGSWHAIEDQARAEFERITMPEAAAVDPAYAEYLASLQAAA